MHTDLSSHELRKALDITKALLVEASNKGTLNDFWVVIDCDSDNYKDYIHRSNTQGLINIICKNHKNLCNRKKLDSVALFASSDKARAETEAKRRAKLMKIELVSDDKKTEVNESTECAECKAKKQKFLDKAKKHEHQSKMMMRDNPEMGKSYANLAKFSASEAADAKCDSCKKDNKKVDENYYNPRNVVANQATSGASTDNTVSNMENRQDRTSGVSGPHDPTTPEHAHKVIVPKTITNVLTSRAKDAREYGEKLPVTHTDDKQFYSDLAQVFDDLNTYLKSGTVHDIKLANIFMTSLMGPMLYEIPTEVVRFIAYGGTHAPLKSFVNSITVPQGGFSPSLEKKTEKK